MDIGEQIRARRPSILLVEDNELNQTIMRDLLEGIGCQIKIVSTGQEAIETITQNHNAYQVILMDIGLPDIDGLEVTRQIRQQEENNGEDNAIPIIALTGHMLEDEKEKCLESGMNAFTIKPVDDQELQTLLYQFLFPQNV